MSIKQRVRAGFTIVELLIVIVVIGILAAITIVAYNGFQTRANNSATISKASQIAKLIKGYQAETGGIVTTASGICVTKDNICTQSDGTAVTAGNTVIINNLSTIGSVPTTTTAAVEGKQGIRYNHWAIRTFNGQPATMQLTYYLRGNGVNCTLPDIRSQEAANAVTSTTGYTSTDGVTTICIVSFLD